MRAASNPVRLGKYSLGKIFFTICKYVLLIFAAFCALVPLVSCVITAFKTKAEYNNTNVMTLPESWLYFDNFVTAWKHGQSVPEQLFGSALRSVGQHPVLGNARICAEPLPVPWQ